MRWPIFAAMPAAPVKVTVLTTLYNKGAYVEEAVRSVLANTFTDFELLVVDDASSDGGLETVKAIGDPRIRIRESTVNTGRASAANRGYDAARGEYVAVLDADDLMMPERLAKQVAFMDAHPEVCVSGTWLKAFGDMNTVIEKPATDAEIRSQMLLGLTLSYPSCMIRRSVVQAHQVRCDPDWLIPGMDHLFLVKLGLYGKYASLQEPLTLYRVGAQNMDHGRDRVSDRRLLVLETFRLLEIPAGQKEADLHLMLKNLHTVAPTAARVKALDAWLGRLKAHNRKTLRFPVEAFEKELDMLWSRSFYFLADRNLKAGWEHLRLSRGFDTGKLYYLFNRLRRSRTTKGAARKNPSIV
ncbi:MAG: glycosyltransferase family 2 protein [Flavobacteriales bacterium]